MKICTPAAAGCAPADALSDRGRAKRYDCGAGRELWRFQVQDRPIVERLLRFGAAGVGGFSLGGVDQEGLWLVRSQKEPTLSAWLRENSGPIPWQSAVKLCISIAYALAACENDSLFPGELQPRSLSVRAGAELRVELRAEPLVVALVGGRAHHEPRAESASRRFIAPEQASGAAPDNRANRYVLGLILYRLLSGEHAFVAKGLRLGLEEQAARGAVPFSDEVASALPPGLQSLCLRLLAPEPSARPASAQLIAEQLEAFLSDSGAPNRFTRAGASGAGAEPLDDRALPAPEPMSRGARSQWRPAVMLALAIAVGSVLASALLAFIPNARKPPRPIAERGPLTANQTLAQDCAACHPRQAAEWQRSVMAHSVTSPLFQSLEILIQEQIGRDFTCPNGAGVLRASDPTTGCRDRTSGVMVTGSGGELWCVNCHAPGENLGTSLPPWDATTQADRSRHPLRDLLPARSMEGISCAFCHQVHGPVVAGSATRGSYEGNPSWTSVQTGQKFSMRPEDLRGLFGIANSGYALDPGTFLRRVQELPALGSLTGTSATVSGGAHLQSSAVARAYLGSSEFCGACHDVRLFGTDVIGKSQNEHFKRLRNAYSEWADWARTERQAGRTPATCQGCHMSQYPGVCLPQDSARGDRAPETDPARPVSAACPPGTVFVARAPGALARGRVATNSEQETPLHAHYFSGVDLPLAAEFRSELLDERALDMAGIPLGARQRRDLLLASSVRLELLAPSLRAARLELPLVVQNVGAGHRVPAGFSQEREMWVHLRVTDATGKLVYEVGRVDRADVDLADKTFLRVNIEGSSLDGRGRPLGLFGADVADGPDLPRWTPRPELGGTLFRGKGLINFQNGFLRCVVCIGQIDAAGRCQALPGQERARADRYADGDYDPDTGECRSNLSGLNALFETYFPVGALDASRGVAKAPDAIIDTRSLPPSVPQRYIYELDARGRAPPFRVQARLLFRAFPPYLLRAFVAYERQQRERGGRPSGPLITEEALDRLDVVELMRVTTVVE